MADRKIRIKIAACTGWNDPRELNLLSFSKQLSAVSDLYVFALLYSLQIPARLISFRGTLLSGIINCEESKVSIRLRNKSFEKRHYSDFLLLLPQELSLEDITVNLVPESSRYWAVPANQFIFCIIAALIVPRKNCVSSGGFHSGAM